MDAIVLSRPTVLAILKSLLNDELAALRHLPTAHWDTDLWEDSLIIGEQAREPVQPRNSLSLEADSLELMALATRVNTFFQMHHSGIEDYLLRQRTLGEWAELVREAQRRGSQTIGFRTSGSTGKPKPVIHSLSALAEEVATLAPLLTACQGQPVRRILAPTPCHHIYGFLFSVLLAEHLNIETVRSGKALAALLGDQVQKGDLIVGIPTIWHQLAEQGQTIPAGVLGLTSTAPADPAILEQLRQNGLDTMVELYGSSETAGIGWRDGPNSPFNLLPRWDLVKDCRNYLLDRRTQVQFELGDHVHWVSDRQLIPTGRRDDAVQVAGINVYPHRISDQLQALSEVSEASVRLMRPEEGQRLKAFIVPADRNLSEAELRDVLDTWCQHSLSPAERPRAFRFGSTLPRNDMGKLSDWSANPADPASNTIESNTQ